jgi:hypothetical protein
MFEVGQKIVCVKTHPEGVVKEGEVYTVKDIQIDCCRDLVLDIGIKATSQKTFIRCRFCGATEKNDGVWWLLANRFRPLDDMYNEEIEELTEVLSEPVTF